MVAKECLAGHRDSSMPEWLLVVLVLASIS